MEFLPEDTLRTVVAVLMRITEAAAVLIIFTGAVAAFARAVITGMRTRSAASFSTTRLMFGRFLTLGLEFQLAADLLRTAVAPSFEEIGKLAAVAAIRTALNFFLEREIREEKAQLQDARGSPRQEGPERVSAPL